MGTPFNYSTCRVTREIRGECFIRAYLPDETLAVILRCLASLTARVIARILCVPDVERYIIGANCCYTRDTVKSTCQFVNQSASEGLSITGGKKLGTLFLKIMVQRYWTSRHFAKK